MILIQLQKNNSKHSLMNEQKEKMNLGLYTKLNSIHLKLLKKLTKKKNALRNVWIFCETNFGFLQLYH